MIGKLCCLGATVILPSSACAQAPTKPEAQAVVEKMLTAMQKHDQAAFDSVVLKGAGIIFYDVMAPLNVNTPPEELGCNQPKITKVEPSNLADNGIAMTVVWQCKPQLPDWDGKMAIKFHVENGKVTIGERV